MTGNAHLDSVAALKQLGGNASLLAKLLTKFAAEYNQALQMLREFMNKDDWSASRQLVHTIKGVSGNLYMTPLYKLSAELENRLKSQDPSAFDLFEEFGQELEVTLKEVNAWLQTQSESKPAPKTVKTKNRSVYREILIALNAKQFISEEQLQNWMSQLDLTEDERPQLEQFVLNMEYDSAIKILEQALKRPV